MTALPFHIVDVFAEEKYGGNQLAVVENADSLGGTQMQRIAREMNFSETTFITSTTKAAATNTVRIFTPQTELPFAGHPTLGTAYVLREALGASASDTIVLDLQAGMIPVKVHETMDGDVFWMSQNPPEFGDEFTPASIAPVLSLDDSAVDPAWPVQTVSTGLPSIIVPLTGRDELKQATVNTPKYEKFIEDTDAKLILIFSPETRHESNDLAVRVFAPYYGVPEDPATGSANGNLAGYLVRHRYFGTESLEITVEQGYELKRPSQILLDATPGKDGIDVNVGGRVIPVATGELH